MLRQKQKLPGKALFKKQNTPFFVTYQYSLGSRFDTPITKFML